jgi:V-type H+-transporting ATPase subunit a
MYDYIIFADVDQSHDCVLFFLRFRASLYPCPETAAERREVAIGVDTRIEDLENVSNIK